MGIGKVSGKVNSNGYPMTTLSLSQAAKAVGKSKPALLKAIKTGRLKAIKGNREWQIELSDLHKVWPRLPDEDVNPTGKVTINHDAYETEIRMLREMLAMQTDTITDLRTRLDKAESRKGLWARLFS